MRYDNFTKDDEKRFLSLTEKKGVAATFIYSDKAAALGKIEKFNDADRKVRTVVIDGKIHVPVEFFTKFIGAKAEIGEGKVTLEFFGNKVVASDFVKRNGILFLPAQSTAQLLGLSSGTYFYDRLLVVGDKETVDLLNGDKSLSSAGAYVVFGEYDANELTKADYKQAKDKWRVKLAGSPELNDMTDPDVAKKINAVSEECKKALESLNRADDRVILWGDHPPVESVELSRQYRPIVKLAKGYATYGSDYYHDAEVLKTVKDCMEWMYANMYGEAELTDSGWRSTRLFNWWYWYVDATECITDVIFLVEDHLTDSDKKRYLMLFEHLATRMRTGPTGAMSRICVCTKVGLALEDPKYLNMEYYDFNQLLSLHKSGIDGPHLDYLCFTHGFPHNTSYGVLHLDRVLYVSSILAGTPVAYASPEQYNQFMFAKYMFEPSMYNGLGFLMFTGRSVERSELGRGESIILNLIPMIGVFGEEEDKYLKKMIKRNSVFEEFRSGVIAYCSLYDLAVYKSIIDDDTIPYDNDYEYAHAWYTGDRVAQHRNGYAVGVAMSSLREMSYESINNANKSGWYTGDGAMYLYTDYDNKMYDGVNFLSNNLNVAYRYPGTTEDMQPRVIRSILNGEAWRNPTLFSGGLKFRDKYITCGFDFTAMHFEGPDKNIVDGGYGGGLAVHHNDLVAKKSWFMFDDEIICLGAGITSTMNSPVNTTVEHRRIVKEDKFSQYVKTASGVEKLAGEPYSKGYKDAEWVLMEGHAGYLPLESSSIYVGRYNCEECGGQPFFEMRIEHGENPKNASYAYAVIPYATKEKLDSYRATPDVEIISNTTSVAAVSERKLGITGYVFFEACECNGISVDNQCVITTGADNGTFEITVCDPTQALKQIKLIVDKQLTPDMLCDGMTARTLDGKTEITVDCDDSCGKPFNAIFKM